MKYQAEDFGGEINNQTSLLYGQNKKIDKTELKLMKVESRLSQIVARASFLYLWLNVIGLLVLLTLILIYL